MIGGALQRQVLQSQARTDSELVQRESGHGFAKVDDHFLWQKVFRIDTGGENRLRCNTVESEGGDIRPKQLVASNIDNPHVNRV